MTDYQGNDRARPGSYLGSAPQAGGFGRRAAPAAPAGYTPSSYTPGTYAAAPRAVDSDALSPLARQVIAEHRADLARPAEIEYHIGGHDIQYVEIILDPGEAVVAEHGALIWKDDAVEYSIVLGDGSNDRAHIGSKLLSAGASMISGESLTISQFRHSGGLGSGDKARVALGGKLPGTIVPVLLADTGGTLICHRSAFLAGAKGVEVSASLRDDIMGGLFGAEGFMAQTLTGTGWVFLHVGGALIERTLDRGQLIQVDSGCVVAHEPTVRVSVGFAGGVGASLLGGEGLLLATVAGPGKVWIQTLPFQRIADAIAQTGGPSAGSVVRDGIGEGVSYGIGHGVSHAVKDGGFDLLKKIF